jgi:hypothetical protein
VNVADGRKRRGVDDDRLPLARQVCHQRDDRHRIAIARFLEERGRLAIAGIRTRLQAPRAKARACGGAAGGGVRRDQHVDPMRAQGIRRGGRARHAGQQAAAIAQLERIFFSGRYASERPVVHSPGQSPPCGLVRCLSDQDNRGEVGRRQFPEHLTGPARQLCVALRRHRHAKLRWRLVRRVEHGASVRYGDLRRTASGRG